MSNTDTFPKNYDYSQASWHERVTSIYSGCPIGDYHGQSDEILSMLADHERVQAIKAAKFAMQIHCITENGPLSIDDFEDAHRNIELGTN